MIFSDTIPAIKNTKPGVWPAEPIDPNKPFKYMTRRIIKKTPTNTARITLEKGKICFWSYDLGYSYQFEGSRKAKYREEDILWVRETWRCNAVGTAGDSETAFIEYKDGDGINIDIDHKQSIYFSGKAKWRPSIFMPRKASRLTLEVKSVRAERLQDISEEAVRAEGGGVIEPGEVFFNFSVLWDSINAKRGYSWEKNPWVYVIEFGRLL
jgi:hypothetical protein